MIISHLWHWILFYFPTFFTLFLPNCSIFWICLSRGEKIDKNGIKCSLLKNNIYSIRSSSRDWFEWMQKRQKLKMRWLLWVRAQNLLDEYKEKGEGKPKNVAKKGKKASLNTSEHFPHFTSEFLLGEFLGWMVVQVQVDGGGTRWNMALGLDLAASLGFRRRARISWSWFCCHWTR